MKGRGPSSTSSRGKNLAQHLICSPLQTTAQDRDVRSNPEGSQGPVRRGSTTLVAQASGWPRVQQVAAIPSVRSAQGSPGPPMNQQSTEHQAQVPGDCLRS